MDSTTNMYELGSFGTTFGPAMQQAGPRSIGPIPLTSGQLECDPFDFGGVSSTVHRATGTGLADGGFGANDRQNVTITGVPLYDSHGLLLTGASENVYEGKNELIFVYNNRPNNTTSRARSGRSPESATYLEKVKEWTKTGRAFATTYTQLRAGLKSSACTLADLSDFPFTFLGVKTTGTGNRKGAQDFTITVGGVSPTLDVWSTSLADRVSVCDHLYVVVERGAKKQVTIRAKFCSNNEVLTDTQDAMYIKIGRAGRADEASGLFKANAKNHENKRMLDVHLSCGGILG